MRYFYLKSNAPLCCQACGNLISKDGFIHHKRCYHAHVLILILDGTLYITSAGQEFAVKPNEYILLPAGDEHYGTKASNGKLSYLWTHFTADVDFFTCDEPFDLHNNIDVSYFIPEHYKSAETQRIHMLFNQLLDFSRHENLYTSQMTSYAMSMLAMEITQEFLDTTNTNNTNISPVVYTISEWIRANCYKHISINDIADEFGYNAGYLSALFKKHTGNSLNQYLTNARIDCSKNLLSYNNVSIKEAAYSSGFLDEKYFMRVFKKHEGITPSEFKYAFHKKSIN